jgi:4-amino-4-deoxy-L-arabinose transferase-like glycosyltransferase
MNNKRIKILFFLFIILFLFIHHFFGYLGHYGYDDMEYAQLAKQWVDGNFHLSNINHFTYRWTIVGLTGLSYFLFGMNDFASALPSLFVTISILVIIYWMTRNKSTWISIITMSLFIFNPWTLFYSDKIMPDLYIALSVLGALATYWNYRFNSEQKYTFLHALFLAGFLFLGFLTKETILLLVPVLLFIVVCDFIQKRTIKFWIQSVLIGAVILLFYFILIKIKTGNMWMRFNAISTNSYVNPCSYDLLPVSELLSRITFKFWFEMICQVMLVGIVFLVPVLRGKSIREFLKMKDENSFLITVSLVTLVAANFMTINFKSYVPMCVDVRHYLYAIPLIAIAFAPQSEKFITNREGRFSVPLIALGMTLIALSQSFYNELYFFVPFTLFCFFRAFIKTEISKNSRNVLFVIFIAILFVLPVFRIFKENKEDFRSINTMIKKHFKNNQSKTIVFTDHVLKRISDYYLQYDTINTRFVDFYDAGKTTIKNDEKVYILFNDYTIYVTDLKKDSLPLFILDFQKKHYVLEDSTYNMRLYKVNNRKDLLIYEKKIKIVNDMESDTLAGWSINPLSLVKDKAQSGIRSNLVNAGGYSVTYIKPLKEIANDSSLWVDVSASCWAYLSEKIDAQIVVSYETNDGKTITWRGNPLTKDLKKYGHWGKVVYDNRFNIPPNSVNNTLFKIYIWNDQSKPIYIDDIDVKFDCVGHI